ncbi:MBL fold metallo-hydrolase [Segnochrobactraceae bacterium EtOH-i3]
MTDVRWSESGEADAGAGSRMARAPDDLLTLTFWGVRGSTPVPGRTTLRYGGDTTCLQIQAGPHFLIIDCGSGARRLGHEMMRSGQHEADLFFTHSHLDHVCGLPFFWPAFDPRSRIRVWAGHIAADMTTQEHIARFMSPPIFPVPPSVLKACSFLRFRAGSVLEPRPGLVVSTMVLNHPGGATGYRFHWKGRSIAIITDHEHGDPEIDAALVPFVSGADVMIYDSMFTDADYEPHRGWGHSTWSECLALAARAGVRVPVIFHHDPDRSDDELDAIAAEAAALYPGALVAREGMTLVA